jgi:phage tail-like protein
MKITTTALALLAIATFMFTAEVAFSAPRSAGAPVTQRLDPYKNFKFRVLLDGREVAGVTSVSGLVARAGDVVKRRNGGDPSTSHKSPGRNKFEPIILERGLTQDLTFEQWAKQASASNHPQKDLVIEMHDESGRVAARYKIFRAWVSEYQGLPDLDANANAVAIQHLKLENEGWERDLGQ